MDLLNTTIGRFIVDLSAGEAIPGGGTASALTGVMSASLVAMVSNVTLADPECKRMHGKAADMARRCAEICARFVELSDADAASYSLYMSALSKPKRTAADRAERNEAVCDAARAAARAALDMVDLCAETASLAVEAAARGAAAARCDAVEAAILARAAAESAAQNVITNVRFTHDDRFNKEAESRLSRARAALEKHEEEARGYM